MHKFDFFTLVDRSYSYQLFARENDRCAIILSVEGFTFHAQDSPFKYT